MLNVDISKAVPAKAFDYAAALMPGLFFEISVLLANPSLVQRIVAGSGLAYGLGHYALLAIGLILAFIVGNGFMLLVQLIQQLLGYAYRVGRFLWKQFCKWPMLPMLEWSMNKPWLNRRHWIVALLKYAREKVFVDYSEELRNVYPCWHLAAEALLRKRYGIDPRETQKSEWEGWYSSLGRPLAADVRGSVLMMASHATGWCGLAAAQFAPVLRSKYYLGFSSLLVLCGLLHDWYLAVRLNDGVWGAYIRLRRVLAELRQIPPGEGRPLSKPGGENGTVGTTLDDG